MIKRKEKIPKLLKEQVLSKLFDPNYLVPDLSKSYGISRSTLYKWRCKAKNKGILPAAGHNQKEFVELLVKEPNDCSRESSLQKASLTFEDFSIAIEGKVSSRKFISILKILEGSC